MLKITKKLTMNFKILRFLVIPTILVSTTFFNKFQDAVNGTLNHVKEELLPDVDFSEFDREYEDRSDSEE